MIFTLEALQAGRGDCLILHYGRPDAPQFLVIDGGGPSAKPYQECLKPRLEQLLQRWKNPDDDKLEIPLMMVSHIDDDHLAGVLQLFRDARDQEEHGQSSPFNIQTLWHNSFDDMLGFGAEEAHAKVASLAKDVLETGKPEQNMGVLSAGVIASVRTGRELRILSKQLGIPLNRGFRDLVMARPNGDTKLSLGGGMSLWVLCPTEKRLDDLRGEWEKAVRKISDAGSGETAAFVDRSVANLSSVVVLLECGEKKILLTGDARGDDILDGLETAGLLAPGGSLHVDIFKLPHHGSSRNSAPELYQRILADHYVISANGENGNPEPDVLQWIAQARGNDPYTIHITNAKLYDPKARVDLRAEIEARLNQFPAPKRKLVYRQDPALSLKIDLADPVEY